jgi:hypothetical protein
VFVVVDPVPVAFTVPDRYCTRCASKVPRNTEMHKWKHQYKCWRLGGKCSHCGQEVTAEEWAAHKASHANELPRKRREN